MPLSTAGHWYSRQRQGEGRRPRALQGKGKVRWGVGGPACVEATVLSVCRISQQVGANTVIQ